LGEGNGDKPIVALPPTFINPKRRKGTERVVMPGTSSRITITSSGFDGTSLEVMVAISSLSDLNYSYLTSICILSFGDEGREGGAMRAG
jgi:hypothetical protein